MGDTWKYSTTTQSWTYFHGLNDALHYPSEVQAYGGNPGPRIGAIAFMIDSNLYLFGGLQPVAGSSPDSPVGIPLNDVWGCSTNPGSTWTWWTGGPDPASIPGPTYPTARVGPSHFVDAGNYALWVWAGHPDAQKTGSIIQELWRFKVSTKTWTLAWRSLQSNQASYPAVPSDPMARPEVLPDGALWAVTVSGGMQHLWTYGGRTNSHISELWQIVVQNTNIKINVWNLWNISTHTAVYPAEVGTTCLECNPGYRHSAIVWVDSGRLYLKGGLSVDSLGNEIIMEDTWAFSYLINGNVPAWTWVAGGQSHSAAPTTFIPPAWQCVYASCFIYGSSTVSNDNYNDEVWYKSSGFNFIQSAALSSDRTPQFPAQPDSANVSPHPPSLIGSGSVLSGDDIYVAFGESYNGNTNEMWKYTRSTQLWTYLGGETGEYTNTGRPPPQTFPTVWNSETHLWLFGGQSGDDFSADLWQFVFETQLWTPIQTKAVNAPGVYIAPNIWPGARTKTAGWFDGTSFWMFGGFGFDELSPEPSFLNDLWKFDISANTWEYVSGSTTGNTPPKASTPGGLAQALATGDGSNFWIYGGYNQDGFVGDFWQFSSPSWSRISSQAYPEYPAKGTTTPTASPGSRIGGTMFYYDHNVFIFAGEVMTSASTFKQANDLWVYKQTGQAGWYWLYGSSDNPPSVSASSDGTITSIPSGRSKFASVFSGSTLWFFSGVGFPSSVTPNIEYYNNDLWSVNVAKNFLTTTTVAYEWKSGVAAPSIQSFANQTSVMGVRQGASFAGESDSRIWMYGGYNPFSTYYFTNSRAVYADLWQYSPTQNEWTYVKGYLDRPAYYSPLGETHPLAWPGPRTTAVTWMSGTNLWLFGGKNDKLLQMNDVWRLDTTKLEWYWEAGSKAALDEGSNSNPAALARHSYYTNEKLWIYGGITPDGSLSGKLWEFDTTTKKWILHFTAPTVAPSMITPVHPGMRSNAGIWHLPSLGVVRLYGGSDGDTASYNDFWEFDITTKLWTYLSGTQTTSMPVYPTERRGTCSGSACNPGSRAALTATWVYNGVDIVLYGGIKQGNVPQFNDLWRYSQSSGTWLWEGGDKEVKIFNTAVNGPLARILPACYVSPTNIVYMFGGIDVDTATKADLARMTFETTFEFSQNPITTSIVPNYPLIEKATIITPNPGANYGSQLHVANNNLYFTNTYSHSATLSPYMMNSKWSYDIPTAKWTFEQYVYNGSMADRSTFGVSWTYNGYLYTFGGLTPAYQKTSYLTRAKFGAQTTYDLLGGKVAGYGVYTDTQFPGSRYLATSWLAEDCAYVFGGNGYTDTTNALLNELWRYNNTDNTWEFLGGGSRIPDGQAWPDPHSGPTSATNGTHAWVYGLTKLNLPDLWLYSIESNTWQRLPTPSNAVYPDTLGAGGSLYSPGGVQYASSVVIKNHFFLFGGLSTSYTLHNDIWEYDTDSQVWYWTAGPGTPTSAQPLGVNTTRIPAARQFALTAGTENGMWLFGGQGYSKSAVRNRNDFMSDLWFIRIDVQIIPPSTTGDATIGGDSTTVSAAATTGNADSTTSDATATTTSTATADSTTTATTTSDATATIDSTSTTGTTDSTTTTSTTAASTADSTTTTSTTAAATATDSTTGTTDSTSTGSTTTTAADSTTTSESITTTSDSTITGTTSSSTITTTDGAAAATTAEATSTTATTDSSTTASTTTSSTADSSTTTDSTTSDATTATTSSTTDTTTTDSATTTSTATTDTTSSSTTDSVTTSDSTTTNPTTSTTSSSTTASAASLTTTTAAASTPTTTYATATATSGPGTTEASTTATTLSDSATAYTSSSTVDDSTITTTTTDTTTTTSSSSSTTHDASSSTSSSSTTGPVSVCGNGIIEPGEACDSRHLCCNQTSCKFARAGVVCGNPTKGECDGVDYCTGASEICEDLGRPSFVCSTSTTHCTIPMVCGNSTTTCPPPLVLIPDKCGKCGGDNSTCSLGSSNPGTCGDGVCLETTGETCENCVLDCGFCLPAPCLDNCNGRGRCDNGRCVCDEHWSGPSCNTELVPIVTISNGTNLQVGVGNTVYFSLALVKVVELSSNDSVVVSYPLNTQNISGVANISDGIQTWEYTIKLDNSAIILLHFIMTGNAPLPIQFGNNNLTLQPNSIKLSLEVVNWPFSSLKNRLRLDMSFISEQADACTTANSTVDASGNVRWTEFSVNEKTLYGSFLNYALIDQVEKPMQVNTISDGSILSFVIPHFWVHALIDPDFSVILIDKPSNQKNTKGECGNLIENGSDSSMKAPKMIAGIAVAGAAVVALGTGGFILWKRKQQRLKRLSLRKSNVGPQADDHHDSHSGHSGRNVSSNRFFKHKSVESPLYNQL